MRESCVASSSGGYASGMSDDTPQSSSTDPYDPDLDPDTDATMTAPDEGRPTGTGSASESELLDEEEEEGPADE